MARRSRYSTSTVTDDGHFVPWLAARGPLSYSPEFPPDSDYFFQYGWVLPSIFGDTTNKREHFYFGERVRSRSAELFSFWQAARAKSVATVALHFGQADEQSVRAPVAAYAASFGGESHYVLMQHGSYLLLAVEHQPLLDRREVILYRGIGTAEAFRFPRFGQHSPDSACGRVLRAYLRTQRHVLSDSALSFNSVHDRAKRAETSHIRDGTWLTDEIARDFGLEVEADGRARELWHAAHQSFTLVEHVAKWKFGPNYVKCKTPLYNIRLTTFFAGEFEVRVVDPDRVEFLECVGCTLREPRWPSTTAMR